MKTQSITTFLIGALVVWGSHATKLEEGFSSIELVNVIAASVLGGAIQVRNLWAASPKQKP